MPKGKAKGRRGGGTTGAERRAIARDLPAIKAIAESCDKLREEWRECGGDGDGGGGDGDGGGGEGGVDGGLCWMCTRTCW